MAPAERQSPPFAAGSTGAPAAALAMRSPFVRLRELLGDTPPGMPAISLAVGEPQHGVPSFVGPVLAGCLDEFGKYPMNKGIDELCTAAAAWLGRRFALPRPLDPATEILVLNGSREGLFLAGIAAARWATGRALGRAGRPAVLMPNPFYGAYEAGAVAAHCEAVYLPASAATGFLPDLDSLSDDLLARTVAFYLASPANPQGSVASPAYFARLAELACRHGFLVFSDECYSEIYTQAPPPSMLEHAGSDFQNVVAFQSLSKRSNLPGLRVGFAAGDKTFLTRFLELRNVSSPQVPIPMQRVAIAAYEDERHVEESRALYARKFDLADQILGNRYGYRRPAGGFLLWLDVSAHGADDAVTLKLWTEAGVRVIPGSYLAREQADGTNPGAGYIRVAMVQDVATTADALHRIVSVLG